MRSEKSYYQTWLYLRRYYYADKAVASTTPGLGDGIYFSLTTTTMTTISSNLNAKRIKDDYSTLSSLTTVDYSKLIYYGQL
jgi:hypothetical protein